MSPGGTSWRRRRWRRAEDRRKTLGGVALVLVGVAVAILAVYSMRLPTPAEPRAAIPTYTPSPEPKEAAFFGDSYFNGSNYAGKLDSMGFLAGERLGYRTAVSGTGGTGFTVGNKDAGVGTYLEQMKAGGLDARYPTLIVIEGGLNDRSTVDQIEPNAKAVLEEARREFPKAKIVLVGPVDPDGDMGDTAPVVEALRSVAEAKDVPFVDASAFLDGHYDLIGDDGIHPTVPACKILGRKLAAAIERVA